MLLEVAQDLSSGRLTVAQFGGEVGVGDDHCRVGS